MNNKRNGNAFEKRLCQELSKAGFWVHNFANKTAGQPIDIIAVRNGFAYIIDAKDCKNDKFDMRRIEENQANCIMVWAECNPYEDGWFAMQFSDNSIYLIAKHTLDYLVITQGKTILNKNDIVEWGCSLETWLLWKGGSIY